MTAVQQPEVADMPHVTVVAADDAACVCRHRLDEAWPPRGQLH